MNTVRIIVQAKDDPKNLLESIEKARTMPVGLTVVFMEGATKGGQLGIEFIIKGTDVFGNETIISYAVTENNFEGMLGAFIGVRMRFGRMPDDQWEMVRHYMKDRIKNFLSTLDDAKRTTIEEPMRKFFNL